MLFTEFIRSEKGKYCEFNTKNTLKEFIIASSTETATAGLSRNSCEDYCRKEQTCWGCSVHCGSPCQWNAIPECGTVKDWHGMIEGDITQKSGINLMINDRIYV